MVIKLSAQVIIKNLRNMHKSLPPREAKPPAGSLRVELPVEYYCRGRTGPACKTGDHTHSMADATAAWWDGGCGRVH